MAANQIRKKSQENLVDEPIDSVGTQETHGDAFLSGVDIDRDDFIEVRGGALYLPVDTRIVLFRRDHPDWSIETELVRYDDRMVVVRAVVRDNGGVVRASAYASELVETVQALEKAETAAVGRALGFLGYSTRAFMKAKGIKGSMPSFGTSARVGGSFKSGSSDPKFQTKTR
jgi:hypothetical protein